MVDFRDVTPDYFRALDMRIVSGRGFSETHRAYGPPPVIFNATLARRMFGGENPIGQRLNLDGDQSWSLVIGVAADAKNNGIEGPADPEYWRLRINDSPQPGRRWRSFARLKMRP